MSSAKLGTGGDYTRMVLGVDVGGTFTDAVLIRGVELITAKLPSTPEDQSIGVMAAVEQVLDRASAAPSDIRRFVHGMTVATNALLEGAVAPTALLATEGFADIEELGRQTRPELYRLCAGNPPPLVPAERRLPVPERCGPDGVIRELEEQALRDRIAELAARERFDGIAICLLWSFRHPAHELRCAEIAAELLPGVHVATSSETAPVFREYERFATTIVDAALSPILNGYLARLIERATSSGLPTPEIMLSSGGVARAATAARHAAWTVLSGPAGGAVAASSAAARSGPLPSGGAIALDMGGTSCDVSLSEGGRVAVGGGRSVGDRSLALPMLDIHTVGAGGGSIAWTDSGGALRVGPRSAGARPGPACLGKGGSEPTVTDANLLLGRLSPASGLAGGAPLDVDAAERAVAGLAGQIGLPVIDTAAGIARVAETELAAAVRVMTVERGVDPRSHVLVAFGGAGPLHACAVADALEIPTVLIPAAAGVLSALGLGISERRIELVESAVLSGPDLSREAVAEIVERLGARGRAELESPDAEIRCGFDLRYAGQAFELTVPGDPSPDPASLADGFERAHRDRFGFDDPGAAVELVSVRVAAFESTSEPPAHRSSFVHQSASRQVQFEAGPAEAAIYAGVPRSARGPAICELHETTVLIPPGWSAIGEAGSISLEVSR